MDLKDETFPPKSGNKICEICGQADRRATSSFLQNIVTCEACKKFLERCQKKNKMDFHCDNGGRRGIKCNLAIDRPCKKCRLDMAIQLVTKMKASSSSSPTIGAAALKAALNEATIESSKQSEIASSSVATSTDTNAKKHNIEVFFQKYAETDTFKVVKNVEHSQVCIRLSKKLAKPPCPTTEIYQQPTHYENVRNEATLRRIMEAASEKCDANYLTKKGIPDGETEFWKLVSWCIQDIALANLPFATQLAGSLCRISHIDMCRLVENSYCLMFYAQTGLPNRLNVVSAFSQLFTKMRHSWTEIDLIMEHAREVIMAIHAWEPSLTEFAFLLATIFCNAVRKDMAPATLTQLEHLTNSVLWAAHAHMTQTQGQDIAQIRYQQLQQIIRAVIRLREARLYALKCFYERNPELAKQTVRPVIVLACNQFKSAWQQDYFQVQMPSYPPPMNYELKTGIDHFTDVIMKYI